MSGRRLSGKGLCRFLTRLIILPLALVTKGLKTGVIFMDEHARFRRSNGWWSAGRSLSGLKLRSRPASCCDWAPASSAGHDAFFGERNALVFRWSSALTGRIASTQPPSSMGRRP